MASADAVEDMSPSSQPPPTNFGRPISVLVADSVGAVAGPDDEHLAKMRKEYGSKERDGGPIWTSTGSVMVGLRCCATGLARPSAAA